MRTYNIRLWHNVRQAQYLNIEAESLEDAKAKALKAYQDFLAYIDAPYLAAIMHGAPPQVHEAGQI